VVTIVTFLPDSGCPGVGETDEEGRYELKSISFRGALPGDYKVAISYWVAADGTPRACSRNILHMVPPVRKGACLVVVGAALFEAIEDEADDAAGLISSLGITPTVIFAESVVSPAAEVR